MCKQIIQHSARNIGKTYKSTCNKPEYKEGLCKYHYKKKIKKSTLFGDREGYREATQKDLDLGKRIYLKNKGSYGGHRCIKGVIVIGDHYKPTNIKADPSLFVIRNK